MSMVLENEFANVRDWYVRNKAKKDLLLKTIDDTGKGIE